MARYSGGTLVLGLSRQQCSECSKPEVEGTARTTGKIPGEDRGG